MLLKLQWINQTLETALMLFSSKYMDDQEDDYPGDKGFPSSFVTEELVDNKKVS